jgi:cobalamin synthase
MKELKKYLTINCAFSAISGMTMLLLSSKLNSLFDIDNVYIFPVIGANLLIFSAFVWYASSRQLTNKMLVTTITILDLLYPSGEIHLDVIT